MIWFALAVWLLGSLVIANWLRSDWAVADASDRFVIVLFVLFWWFFAILLTLVSAWDLAIAFWPWRKPRT